MKGTIYNKVVRPAMLYGQETVATTKRLTAALEVAEMRMLRFSLGHTRLDKIQNEQIRKTAQVTRFMDKAREERLRWFEHVNRRGVEHVTRRMLGMKTPGKRKWGRPNYMAQISIDLKEARVSLEDTHDRDIWRKLICCGNP